MVCEPVDVPYESRKVSGETDDEIKVTFLRGSLNDSDYCQGYFAKIWSASDSERTGVHYLKIEGDLPAYIYQVDDYRNHEWLLDVTYLGKGMECYLTAIFGDPPPGQKAVPDDIELVEITNIRPAP